MTKLTTESLQSREAYSSWISVSSRYSDLDPNEHINNGAINSFFEEGRVNLRAERMALLDKNILSGFALVRFTVEYLKEIKYPGLIDVGTMVKKVGNTSYTLGQALFRGTDCFSVAEAVTVFLNPNSKRPEPIDDHLREILNSLESPFKDRQN